MLKPARLKPKFWIFRLFAMLPWSVLMSLSNIFYWIGYKLLRYRVKVVRQNLQQAFPNLSQPKRTKIEQKFYKNFFDNFLEVIKMVELDNNGLRERVKIEIPDEVEVVLKGNKNIFLMAGHSGNWEWVAQRSGILASDYQKEGIGIYKQQSNLYFNDFMLYVRGKFKTVPVESDSVFKYLIKHKQPSMVYTVADQTAGMNPGVYWADFLGKKAPFFMGTEKISNKLGMECVFIEVTNPNRGYYVMNLKLIKGKDITQQYINLLEDAIKANPHLWLWSHRRWKHDFEQYQERFGN